MGRKMRISLVQMHVDAGSPEANFGRAAERMEQAAADKPDLIVLPEMWNTGYALEVIGTIADPAGSGRRRSHPNSAAGTA